MTMSGIYAIYFDDGGDFNEENIIYIGQSVNIERRMRQHEKSDIYDDYPLIDGLYTPGSTFKIVTAASAIENRKDLDDWEYKPSIRRFI